MLRLDLAVVVVTSLTLTVAMAGKAEKQQAKYLQSNELHITNNLRIISFTVLQASRFNI